MSRYYAAKIRSRIEEICTIITVRKLLLRTGRSIYGGQAIYYECKCQVKMYNFGGIIFRDIHQGYTSSFAALDKYPVICICVTTRRRNFPPVTV